MSRLTDIELDIMIGVVMVAFWPFVQGEAE